MDEFIDLNDFHDEEACKMILTSDHCQCSEKKKKEAWDRLQVIGVSTQCLCEIASHANSPWDIMAWDMVVGRIEKESPIIGIIPKVIESETISELIKGSLKEVLRKQTA